MKKIKINIQTKKILADTVTPIGIYLKLRDQFQNSFLLESSDYHAKENHFSFICVEPLINFIVSEDQIKIQGCKLNQTIKIDDKHQPIHLLHQLMSKIEINDSQFTNGFFGYTTYDSVRYFETIKVGDKRKADHTIPNMYYSFFRFIIRIDHFKNELIIIENLIENQDSSLVQIENLLRSKSHPSYHFKMEGKEESNCTNEEYKSLVSKGKYHCQQGDVFQIVLSRQFSQKFKGDEFNVYRALRSVNPSPYLFYFDFGSYKLFGSSPEAQLKISNRKAIINPIAGTFKRTGDDQKDRQLAIKLSKDPKENAEHTMLVDLARNDLSRNGKNVKVSTYKETQFYSHVIHLVSEVEAKLNPNAIPLQMFADTFPAGTLSGAPKYRAMQLIDQYENQARGFYGGAIGIFGLNGSINHAITIRSFLSKQNTLFFQAGAGIVESSKEESEFEEVNNKLSALKYSLQLAETI